MKGLGQVVVGPQLQTHDLVGHLVSGRQHDDRDLALLPDLAADREAVHVRQHDVEHDQVGLGLAEPGQRLGAVADGLDLIALAGQVEPGELQDVILVVDHQDLLSWHQCGHHRGGDCAAVEISMYGHIEAFVNAGLRPWEADVLHRTATRRSSIAKRDSEGRLGGGTWGNHPGSPM